MLTALLEFLIAGSLEWWNRKDLSPYWVSMPDGLACLREMVSATIDLFLENASGVASAGVNLLG